jgi:hypothetical protein
MSDAVSRNRRIRVMRLPHLLWLLALALSTALLSCSDDDSASPADPPQQGAVDLTGYLPVYDSLYFKVWSDSSSERYAGMVEAGGVSYLSIVDDHAGTQVLYANGKYAGLIGPTGAPIIFSAPVEPPPSSMLIGQTIVRNTTFEFQSVPVSLQVSYTLLDTGTVSAPVGTFPGAVQLRASAVATAVILADTVTTIEWMAKGPGTVRRYIGADTLGMVYGQVNGRFWRSP